MTRTTLHRRPRKNQVLYCNSLVFLAKKIYPEIECYRCSCNEVSDEGCVTAKFFPDFCIGPHVRQNHEIFDCRGHKPTICRTHEMFSSMFYYDCDEVFCFKCLGPRCRHEYRPVSEKAQEVRKTVFEYLNQFDELAKSLAHRKTFVEKCIQSQEEFYPNLSVENFIDDLCKRFERILRSNALQWIEMAQRNLDKLKTSYPVFGIME